MAGCTGKWKILWVVFYPEKGYNRAVGTWGDKKAMLRGTTRPGEKDTFGIFLPVWIILLRHRG